MLNVKTSSSSFSKTASNFDTPKGEKSKHFSYLGSIDRNLRLQFFQ